MNTLINVVALLIDLFPFLLLFLVAMLLGIIACYQIFKGNKVGNWLAKFFDMEEF